MSDDYQGDIRRDNTRIIRAMTAELPPFMAAFFRAREDSTTPRTRVNYARDLRLFFDYLKAEKPGFEDLKALKIGCLDDITPDDIEGFMSYVSYHSREHETALGKTVEREYENAERGKSRKLSSISCMFDFFLRKRQIEKNPVMAVERPKLREKVITRLEPDEVARLLDEAESGDNLTKGESRFHEATKTRDVAILTLLLGTGMRVSECVGLNIEHLNFDDNSAKVTRKGGKESILYFGGEVAKALNDYLDERELMEVEPGHESALFISLKKRRLTDRAIQNLVKKYARLTTLKHITPHKLRSTFGTELYRATDDIYLVASVLGHTSVDTTRKHYVPMDDDRKRRAAGLVKLRED